MNRQGYIYGTKDHGPLCRASVGDMIAKSDRNPPWFVVSHDIEEVLVSEWPGRLFHVEVLEPVTIEETPLGSRIRADAKYVRAIGFKILAEIPVSRLFGAHGGAVCAVIDAAHRLDLSQAAKLSECRHGELDRLFSRAWSVWIDSVESQIPNYGYCLSAAKNGKHGSPINKGFLVLSAEVNARARLITGDGAFVEFDYYGEPEQCLNAQWSGALWSLLDAAMALGAPELLSTSENVKLMAAWQTLSATLDKN
jgi:hypothetical protein